MSYGQDKCTWLFGRKTTVLLLFVLLSVIIMFVTDGRFMFFNSSVYIIPLAGTSSNDTVGRPSDLSAVLTTVHERIDLPKPNHTQTTPPTHLPSKRPSKSPTSGPTTSPVVIKSASDSVLTIGNTVGNPVSADFASSCFDGCEMYVLQRFPKLKHKFHSFFHDLECIAVALPQITRPLFECCNITIIASDLSIWPTSTYRQVFNLRVLPDKQWLHESEGIQMGCTRSSPALSNKHNKMSQLQQYVARKYGLRNTYNMSYQSAEYYAHHGDILIINRHHHRGITNVDALYKAMCDLFPGRCRLVFFEGLSLVTQWHHILNASVVITPHGAAEASFIMVANDQEIKDTIRLIELCPPYTHCDMHQKRPLCPYYFGGVFKNHRIVGIAREDHTWNCSQYRHYQSNGSRRFNVEYRRINNFTVDIDLVKSAIQWDNPNKTFPLVSAQSVDMSPNEFYFYNATHTICDTGQYFDLRN